METTLLFSWKGLQPLPLLRLRQKVAETSFQKN